jgi:hypothetical protein
MVELRRDHVQDLDTDPFVDHLVNELQDTFEAQCLVDNTRAVITDEGELQRRKLECVKAGLYCLRSIHTAWRKYPAVGGRLDGAPIGAVDYMYTARSAAVDKPVGQLAAQYARIMADAVDPPPDDFQSAPNAQLRVNNCFLALKKQFMALFPLLDHANLMSYLEDDSILSEDEASPKTYRLDTSAALHQPSTAAELMSARGLIAAAEDEEHDNQHIFVTGGVLRSKAEKRADLAEQVAKAKKAEADGTARTRVRTSASKATAPAQGKGKARRSATPPVESEEDEEENEAVETPVKKAAAKKTAAGQIKGGKKPEASTAEEQDQADDENETNTAKQPFKKSKAIVPRKRLAPVADDDQPEDDSNTPKAAPKKRAKSTPATKNTASDKSSDKSPSSGTSGEAGSVAPNIVKRGAAAPKWLKDEDDLVKQMIVDHPTWPMPTVYLEYSIAVANTPYQRAGQVLVEYRADFVPFPKGIIASDKERRKYDIAWRTYESVRQHTEKFKANVSNADSSPPYTWEPAQDNLVAGQPKRAPTPRPAYFNNDARTPVPVVNPLAPLASVSNATAPSVSSAAPIAFGGTRRASGWNAVNRLAPVVDNTSGQAGDEATAPAEESAGGNAGVDSIEDFVAQQSAPPSEAGEAEAAEEDVYEEDLYE